MKSRLGDGIVNWVEAWLWVPLSLGFIFFSAKIAFALTGSKPSAEAADWIMEYSQRMVAAVFIILLVSIFKEATSWWPTPEQRVANPSLSAQADAVALLSAGLWAYVILH